MTNMPAIKRAGTETDLDTYVSRAEAARKARRAAPAVDVRGAVTVPQKDIIRRLAASEGGVDKVMHRLFIDRGQLGQYADRGYSPVVRDGEVVSYQSDIVVEIPVDLFNKTMEENKAISDAMLGERVRDDATAAKASKVSTGERLTVQSVKADSLGLAAGGSGN